MENQKPEKKHGITLVGQNLKNEKIRINHCTINIFLKDEKDLSEILKNINLFKQHEINN